ncbi:MAG: nucleoside hydrolase [Actinomycetia bacterium]|nr:nucleoside hydrolase [Actinomycetes bacterium]
MEFPKISTEILLKRLNWPEGKVRMVLDTDTYNEVDDQFALAYALKSKDKLELKAVYAAPFYNNKSTGPADGMEKSYEEIIRIFEKMKISSDGFVYRGSGKYLSSIKKPVDSDAARNLIKQATASKEEPLYVVAIGAITNIASAILMEPKIIKNIIVIWLGGHAFHWGDTAEFNLMQDVLSARIIFDSGVPLIHIPCKGVTTHLQTTIPELEFYLKGKNEICDYLIDIVKRYTGKPYCWSKIIWDVATIAWLINPEWVSTNIVSSPIITDKVRWSFNNRRHPIKSAYYMERNKIFGDLFKKLAEK